jgi:nucleotide-binding universal stress UspA family protein
MMFAALSVIMAVTLPIETVASAANIMFLLLFIQVQMALIALRKKRPDLRRGFKVPWVPFVPIVGIILQLGLAVFLFFYSPMAWLSAAVWIGLGLVVFYGYARRRDRSYEQMVAVREAAERREYRILVSIGYLKQGDILLHAAAATARHYNGELIVLSVVEVSDKNLLARGMERAREVEKSLDGLVASLRFEGIPVKVVVKISHRISYGITETALEERCNLIVVGRARRTGLLGRFAATIVDRVVRSAPAQVMVVSAERWPEPVKNVFLAYERGPHSELTADLAGALGGNGETKVRAVHILPRSATAAESQATEADLKQALGPRHAQCELKVVHAGDIVTGLLRESKDADIIVMGGTEAGMIEQLLGYALPMELADRTATAVVTVYEMPAQPKRWLV